MRFAFYLEDCGQHFSLQRLREGSLALGGQAARFRILFWLVMRGHDVIILNHYDEDIVDNIHGVRICSIKDIPNAVERSGGVDLFVFNNQSIAPELAALSIPAAKAKAMWVGNPIPVHWLLWLNNRCLNRVVCVSHDHRETYRPYPNFHRIEVSYSGIDIDLLDQTPLSEREENLIVFLGAPRKTKGFHNLLTAWPYILQAKPTARLRILGAATLHDTNARLGWTGVLDADLEAKYLDPLVGSERNLEKVGIEFAGLLPIREVFRELRRASIAVVNCNWDGSVETYCRSAIEAQACGTPVVGAARGSLLEVVRHNETGILVIEPVPKGLASAIIRLLSDVAIRQRFGYAGQKWARSIANYEALSSDWEDIAKRAIEDEPAPAPRRMKGDILRLFGYGRARIIARRLFRGEK